MNFTTVRPFASKAHKFYRIYLSIFQFLIAVCKSKFPYGFLICQERAFMRSDRVTGEPSLRGYDGLLKRQYPSQGGSKYREGDLLDPNEW